MTTSNVPEAIQSQLATFEAHYDYDTSYLRDLLRLAPDAYARFAAAQGMSQHRDALGQEAHAVACIAVMLSADCGACAQLNLRMAVEVGVARSLLQTLLDDPTALPSPLDDVFCHAQNVTERAAPDLARSERLRQALGEMAFGELSIAITGALIYPTLKRALGTALACRKPTLDF